MAQFKYNQYLQQSDHPAYDAELTPGSIAENSGIYRCRCGDEIAANKGNPLPPQNHHQHPAGIPIRWTLLVFAQQKQ